jgi:hypothetical protein
VGLVMHQDANCRAILVAHGFLEVAVVGEILSRCNFCAEIGWRIGGGARGGGGFSFARR